MISTVGLVIFLAENIGLIPSGFNKDLKSRVEMYNDDKEYETDDGKYREKEHLDRKKCKECYNTRENEGENEKDKGNNNGTEIEKNHRKVEFASDMYIAHSETSGGSKRCKSAIVFKDDKKL